MPIDTVMLWPDQTNVADGPSLTVYPATEASSRGAVMVLPGGAYHGLAEHEGPDVAERLNEAGFDAAVLRYRLAPDHQHPAMIHDAQRGMRLMRQHLGIRAKKIAVMGFSAGGHLASTLAVHHEKFTAEADDLAGEVTSRPDATVLCYPVIDLQDSANVHTGSRSNLMGSDPEPDLVGLLSTHRHVTSETPPTFLWHTADDEPVPMQNSLVFATACREARVPVELHLYESGVHGIGLAEDHPQAKAWFEACLYFLDRHFA